MSIWYAGKRGTEAWQSLVHVCRRWRCLVLGSPRRLNLQLYCTLLPGTDNLIAALGQSNRIRRVFLYGLLAWQLEEVSAAMHMQVPFPELTDLRLWSNSETPMVIPDSFLGGSAPRLRILSLNSISFPELPKLLLSATHLVQLHLHGIPHSGYISPEAMVALLSALSSLETHSLGFQSPQSRPDWENRSLPPPKRSILPNLRTLFFRGVTEYSEELVARIGTPQLNSFFITFFNQVDFDCLRLAQFTNCTPTFRALDEARVHFNDTTASVRLRSRTSKSSFAHDLVITISCREPDWQVSSIEQVCNNSSEDLYIEPRYPPVVWKSDTIESTLWLEPLRSFTAVKDLCLSKKFAPAIAAALQELVGARITEVLPRLQNIFVEGLEPSGAFQENVGQFVAARQLSNHPIAISVWDKDFNMDNDMDKGSDTDNDSDMDDDSNMDRDSHMNEDSDLESM